MCGKAWSSLNCAPRKSQGEGCGAEDEGELWLHASPLTVLLTELSDLVRRLPPFVSGGTNRDNAGKGDGGGVGDSSAGAVIVASSDVLVCLNMPQVVILHLILCSST